MKFTLRHATARSPASASTRPPPTPAPTSAACGRPTASAWRRPRSRARRRRGWQTVTFADAGRRPAEHDLRRLVLRARTATTPRRRTTSTATRRRARTAARSADAPPLHARPQHRHRRPTASTATAPTSTFPTSSYSAEQLLGRRQVHADRRRPGQVTGVSAVEGGITSANVTWAAPATGGAPDHLHGHAVHRRRRRRRRRPSSAQHRRTTDDHRADAAGPPTRSRCRRPTRPAAGPRLGASNTVTPHRRSLRPRRPASSRSPARRPALRDLDARPARDGDSAITG